VQEEKQGAGTEMWFMVSSEEYFSRWLLMFTDGVKVLEPESLKNSMCQLISALQQNYS
jgi:predicted DNA-binding transcriptional regulator YafY